MLENLFQVDLFMHQLGEKVKEQSSLFTQRPCLNLHKNPIFFEILEGSCVCGCRFCCFREKKVKDQLSLEFTLESKFLEILTCGQLNQLSFGYKTFCNLRSFQGAVTVAISSPFLYPSLGSNSWQFTSPCDNYFAILKSKDKSD